MTMPMGSALCSRSCLVWGNMSLSTKKMSLLLSALRLATSMASTTAVDSSSMEAFAVFMPVRSVTMVWKLMIASRRPWEISGWYGV